MSKYAATYMVAIDIFLSTFIVYKHYIYISFTQYGHAWALLTRWHVWLKHQPGGGLEFLTFGRSESKQMAGL